MRATVKDVAARAGVSPKTVSNVVNGLVPVSEGTRARVEAALAELDYVPNLSARGLRNGRTGVIALALPDLATPYSAELAHHVVEVAHGQGWNVQIEETGKDPHREFELVSRARANLVDGLILNPVALDESAIRVGGNLPPMVLLGEVSQQRVDQVVVDNIAAARDMTLALAGGGRRRIAVLGANGTSRSATAEVRTRGYRDALARLGIPADPALEIACDEWTPGGSAAALRAFLAGHELPEALFCFTDSLAIGALSVLAKAGHRVPGDILVAGFDDVADGQYAVPALTTIGVDKRAMAQNAVRLLTERMAERRKGPVQVELPYRLVIRASTGQLHGPVA
ncbi:LacI family DNA-binding transcriptional regulator [Arthrobacter sp. SDTb3-6]|uniref:LacI family DNA-binding transcriptional regulator n=1 Tax=Arthrobacter sp. SDTb3-6 TaxID=2713571 RepID=UPI00159E7D7B|nr:LacI family DNA-binding transcriptional regulator [Arthrobacter sp. SDTb3-6]NVM99128.1 LacI family transcriptional regulator [Arthrobacter sp. SDTb3-6]